MSFVKNEIDTLSVPSNWVFICRLAHDNEVLMKYRFDLVEVVLKNQPQQFPDYVCAKDSADKGDTSAKYCGYNFGKVNIPDHCTLCGSSIRKAN